MCSAIDRHLVRFFDRHSPPSQFRDVSGKWLFRKRRSRSSHRRFTQGGYSKFFGGTKIAELKFADCTSNFARSAELNFSNEQIFTEIVELNVLQCKCKDFTYLLRINSLRYKNNILKMLRFRALRFISHMLLSFVNNRKYYKKS